jgi:hypothetical protein
MAFTKRSNSPLGGFGLFIFWAGRRTFMKDDNQRSRRRLYFASFVHHTTGERLHARDYGRKAFPISIQDDPQPRVSMALEEFIDGRLRALRATFSKPYNRQSSSLIGLRVRLAHFTANRSRNTPDLVAGLRSIARGYDFDQRTKDSEVERAIFRMPEVLLPFAPGKAIAASTISVFDSKQKARVSRAREKGK